MATVPISSLPTQTSPLFSDWFALARGTATTYKITLNTISESIVTQQACRLATTAALTATYNNGSSGVGATLVNAGALAALSIDSVTVALNDRILVKDQASTLQNGIYTVTTVGSGAVAWVLTRASDYDEASDIDAGDFFTVAFGTVNAKTQWIETAVVATMGTDAITFESNVVAGSNIVKTNNSVAVNANPTFTSITVNNDGLHILDTNASHDLVIVPGSDLTADRNFTIVTGDNARTIDVSAANVTVSSFGSSLVDDASKLVALTTLGVKRGTTAAYGGGGTSNAFTATGLVATDIVTATMLTATNAVAIKTATPSADTLTVVFTADPGANTTVQWIAIATV